MSDVIETIDVNGRPVLDISKLPDSALGSREPVWWGNTLLMFIETTTVVLTLVSYFYLRRNFTEWPPPQPNTVPPLFHPVPDLPIPTIELVLGLISIIPAVLAHRGGRKKNATAVKTGLVILLLVTGGWIVLRFLELDHSHLKFRWDDNAYGSIIWTILGLHLTYLLAAFAEFFIMSLWIFLHGLDSKHGLDVELAAYYWYWTVATWIACYFTVYWCARIL